MKTKRAKSKPQAKPSALDAFAKKLLIGIDFDVTTDLRMIAQEEANKPQNNSVIAPDDVPNEIEYADVQEAHSVQYSESESELDESDAMSDSSAVSIHGDAGFDLKLTGM